MNKVKMTPSLAKALAERAMEKINERHKANDDLLEVEVRDSKEFKRMQAIIAERKKLQDEYDMHQRVLTVKFPRIQNIGQVNYGADIGKWYVNFKRPWVNSEVIKNQILLNGTFTNDSVDNIVDGVIAEHIK